MMITIISVLLIVASSLTVGVLIGPSVYKTQSQKNMEFRYNEMKNTYLSESGVTSMWKPEGHTDEYFSYNIRSFDGGKVWYALETESSNSTGLKDNKVIILGKVEDVYPGFKEHNEAWNRLTEYTSKNGPVGSHEITEELDEILADAGIEIVEKEAAN